MANGAYAANETETRTITNAPTENETSKFHFYYLPSFPAYFRYAVSNSVIVFGESADKSD